jgi:hypothetical protein
MNDALDAMHEKICKILEDSEEDFASIVVILDKNDDASISVSGPDLEVLLEACREVERGILNMIAGVEEVGGTGSGTGSGTDSGEDPNGRLN